jgi:hypothetical protein
MSTDLETVFVVPRLNSASVAAGACCPVPAEALIVPELEAVAGVREASADWSSALVRVRHALEVTPDQLAQVLDDLSYPAHSWNSTALNGVTKL